MNLASALTDQEQASLADAVEALKTVDFNALLLADEADFSASFKPLPHDGAFFQENFIDQFIAGDLNTRASLMITSNSWEGNLFVPLYSFLPFYGGMSKISL